MEEANVGTVIFPIPRVFDKLFIKPGDSVKSDTPLAGLIAMNKEHGLKAAMDGVVKVVPNAE